MAKTISGMLYHTAANDPLTYLAVSLTFLAVVTMASYLPAKRVAQLDPMVALRVRNRRTFFTLGRVIGLLFFPPAQNR